MATDVLLSFVGDYTLNVRPMTLICDFFILPGSWTAARGGEQIVPPTMFLFKAAKGMKTVNIEL